MSPTTASELDARLVDVFCRQFGESYRDSLGPQTNMDDVPEWDSMSFLDLVFAIEQEFGIELSPDESSQMFQLRHIQRIVQGAVLDVPHDDVAHACCLLHQAQTSKSSDLKIVVLSGSSTREGFLRPREAEALLCETLARPVSLYNLSVSGLVVAETLQLLEVLGRVSNVHVVIGTSPIILGGCGTAEFIRSATHRRFHFAAPVMESILAEHGYQADDRVLGSLSQWTQRYLKGRNLDSLQYEPYLYPTLAPWSEAKYASRDDILRFYNSAILNHEQSRQINAQLFEAIAQWAQSTETPLSLVDLTIHSRVAQFLEELGQMVSAHETWANDYCRRWGVTRLDAVRRAAITDADFRDPAHLFQRREEYTRAFGECLQQALTQRAYLAAG